jgi:hypothetical protein
LTTVQCKESGEEVQIETSLLKSVVRSGELGRYWATPSALVLFPYEIEGGHFQLICSSEMAKHFPSAWAYLKSHKKLLSEREHGKFAESGWWQLYPKNLAQWEQAKIMVPYMITDLAAYYDSGGTYFVNVTTGGFGITTHRSGRNLEWLTVLLNSQLLDWFLKKVSTTFHGGYFAANKQYLVQLPIADCRVENQESAVALSRSLHYLKATLVPATQTMRDPLMLAYWERVLNGLVYELYFPEEVHGAGLGMFDEVERAGIPDVTSLAEGDRLPVLRRKFEELHDGTHPLRLALDKLQTLETVRIIEGKA